MGLLHLHEIIRPLEMPMIGISKFGIRYKPENLNDVTLKSRKKKLSHTFRHIYKK